MAECVCNILHDDGATLIREDGQPTYESRAAPGYGTDVAKWQIKKFFYDASNNCLRILYANGDAGFVHVQTGYAGFTYTPTGE